MQSLRGTNGANGMWRRRRRHVTVQIRLADLNLVCLHSLLDLRFDGFFRLHVILSGKSDIAYISIVYLRGSCERQSWPYLIRSEVTKDDCSQARHGKEALSSSICSLFGIQSLALIQAVRWFILNAGSLALRLSCVVCSVSEPWAVDVVDSSG